MSARFLGLLWTLLVLGSLAGVAFAQGGKIDSCTQKSGLSPEVAQKIKPILEGIAGYYQQASPQEQQNIKSQMSKALKKSTNAQIADKVVRCVIEK